MSKYNPISVFPSEVDPPIFFNDLDIGNKEVLSTSLEYVGNQNYDGAIEYLIQQVEDAKDHHIADLYNMMIDRIKKLQEYLNSLNEDDKIEWYTITNNNIFDDASGGNNTAEVKILDNYNILLTNKYVLAKDLYINQNLNQQMIVDLQNMEPSSVIVNATVFAEDYFNKLYPDGDNILYNQWMSQVWDSQIVPSLTIQHDQRIAGVFIEGEGFGLMYQDGNNNYSNLSPLLTDINDVQEDQPMCFPAITFTPLPFDVNSLSWASSSWEEIIAALEAHDEGVINIYNYFHIGDTRIVPLAAMAATGVGESHIAQDVELVLVDKDVIDLSSGGKCHFVWQQKGLLAKNTTSTYGASCGYMNSTRTNVGGWRNCARRTWCNNIYFTALPSGFQSVIKEVNIKTSTGNAQTTIETTQDKIFFPCEYNILGKTSFSVDGEDAIQWEYYKTASNFAKYVGVSTLVSGDYWWTRSPKKGSTSDFVAKSNSSYDGVGSGYANNPMGLALCGCI